MALESSEDLCGGRCYITPDFGDFRSNPNSRNQTAHLVEHDVCSQVDGEAEDKHKDGNQPLAS